MYAPRLMGYLRSILFDNLGLKFTALLLAVLVYLNVYTDRPTTLLVSFPLEFVDLEDSLSVSGPSPAVVQAELRGTGKQLILMRVKEPRMKLSLSGARRGRFERALSASDLPLPPDASITMENLVGPRVVTLEIDRKVHRDLPVKLQLSGQPASGYRWVGEMLLDPGFVRLTGPEQVLLAIDSVALAPVRFDGKRDTVTAMVGPERLPDWCTAEPAVVKVRLPLARRVR
ncbi:MAG: YbbR-like domain-containing protein [Candidatus Eisenbacteria bacterium]